MQRRLVMCREEAATLLGVPVDSDAAAVRQAWRMWARIAHPDAGGDPEHFARLEEARRVLLIPPPVTLENASRDSLGSVLRRPAQPLLLLAAAAAAVSVILLTAVLPEPSETLRLALAALPGSIAAAGVALWGSRQVLEPRADRGHRIVVLLLCWLPIVAAQVTLAAVMSVGLISVLPVVVLPLVVVVAAMDPGYGLWQPVSGAGAAREE